MPSVAARPFALALFSAAALLPLAGAALASDAAAPREATITVSGTGQAKAVPDTAMVTLSVTKQEASARESLDANSKAMSAVLDALKADGIESRDLQTSGFSIQPVYSYPQASDGTAKPPELVGYQTTNSLTVRLRDLSKAGALIDKTVSLGINQGGDIRFINEDPKPILKAARADAVKDALEKAREMTEAAGVGLGRVVDISESSAPSMPVPMMAMAKEAAAPRDVPMAPGENSYDVTVTVTFAIKQ